MKIAVNSKSFLLLVLFAMAGANAASAADSAGDAQQQARSLLGGRNFGTSGAAPRAALESSTASASSSIDAQEQGRQMILGRPSSRVPSAPTVASAPQTQMESESRKVGERGDNSARRMILRSEYSENSVVLVRRVSTMRVGGGNR